MEVEWAVILFVHQIADRVLAVDKESGESGCDCKHRLGFL